MAKTILKYNINEFVMKLPHELSIGDFVKKLEGIGISKDAFYRDRKIKQASRASIPSDRLLLYAKVFGCSLDQLINYDVHVKSIHHDLNKRTRKTRTGLS